jgi:endonuclease/exonuclease/phosphatase family metal-dependent hydrolase
MVEASPYPTIVCGDFNDTPVSYTIHKLTRDLTDVFREVGRGFSHTYRGFFDMLRIDYVMCSDEFTPISYQVIDSWGVEEKVVRRADTRDTVLVRKYGNKMAPPTEEQALQAGIEVVRDTLSGKALPIYNRVEYSDHHPVVVRLKLNKNKK